MDCQSSSRVNNALIIGGEQQTHPVLLQESKTHPELVKKQRPGEPEQGANFGIPLERVFKGVI